MSNFNDIFLRKAIIQSLENDGTKSIDDILSDFGFCRMRNVMTRYESLVDKVTDYQYNQALNNVAMNEEVVSSKVPSLIGKNDLIVTELKNSITVGEKCVKSDEYVNVKSNEFETTIQTKQNDVSRGAIPKLASKLVVENFDIIMQQQEAEREKNQVIKLKKMKSMISDRLLMLDAKKASWSLKVSSNKYKFYENVDGFKQRNGQYGNYYGFFEFQHSRINNYDAQILMVGRDVCKEINGDRPALDLIMTRKLATGLGYTDIGTEIVMIPLLRISQDKVSFHPGGYTSLLGSIQRRTANFSDSNYLNRLSAKMNEAYYVLKQPFEFIVKMIAFPYIQNYLNSCFMDQVVEKMKSVMPLCQFKTADKFENHLMNLNDKRTDDLFKLMDENSARMVQTCVNKCKKAECGLKGLMYGSRVTKKRDGYVLPCGDVVTDLHSYYSHPCAVRGLAMQYNSRDSVCNDEINKSSLYGHKCQYCFRVYADELNSRLCSIFCCHIGSVNMNSYRTKTFESLFNTEVLFSSNVINDLEIGKEVSEKKTTGMLHKISYDKV